MRIKTYVINLKNASDRLNTVLAELSEYPFMDLEVIEAVDGRKMSSEEKDEQFDARKFLKNHGGEVTPGEIGCTLSHRECYRRLLDSQEEFVLICEDDVRFFAGKEFMENFLMGIVGKMPTSPYVMTLSKHMIYYPKSEYQIGQYSFCRLYHAWGTCAYLINRKAAEVMLKIHKPYYPADDYREMDRLGIWVEGVYPMLAVGKSEIGEIPSTIVDRSDGISVVKSWSYYRKRIYSYCSKKKVCLFFYRKRARLFRKKIPEFFIYINFLKRREDYLKIVDTRNS